jgi:hypothetical protein
VCQQPYPDDEVTFAWPKQAPDTDIFDDEAWVRISYLVDAEAVVEIWLLAPAGWLHPTT